jgi:catechol 2,3-dioxygenase-like lactoylglutathione lyase family enzyme
MTRLKLITLLVNDYDAAIEFYTQKLGFEVAEDAAVGDDRWVTLSLPGQRDVALALHPATTGDDQALVGKQAGSSPLLGFDTVDCLGDYHRLMVLRKLFGYSAWCVVEPSFLTRAGGFRGPQAPKARFQPPAWRRHATT